MRVRPRTLVFRGVVTAMGIALDSTYCTLMKHLKETELRRILRCLTALGFKVFKKELLKSLDLRVEKKMTQNEAEPCVLSWRRTAVEAPIAVAPGASSSSSGEKLIL